MKNLGAILLFLGIFLISFLSSGNVLLAFFAALASVFLWYGVSAAIIFTEGLRLRRLTAKEGAEARKIFIEHAAHELRTPLAILKGNIDTDIKPHAKEISGLQQAIENIDGEIKELSKIVNNLLKLGSEGYTSPENFKKIVLREIIKNVIQKISTGGSKITFRINVPASHCVWGSALDLEKLFEVVIENSVAYNKKDLVINLSSTTTEDKIKIRVSDNGIGIRKRDLPRIFEHFYRTDEARARRSGAGLGLALAKSIAEAHGGEIWAESVFGEGATFTIILPTHGLRE